MNKRRSFFGMAGAGLLSVLALFSGMQRNTSAPISMVNSQNRIAASNKQKQTPPPRTQTRNTVIEEIGGLPLASVIPNYGMSPKEYGMNFGNGGSKRSNRLRYSHNAKLKRRMA